jgi:hypothetical protein
LDRPLGNREGKPVFSKDPGKWLVVEVLKLSSYGIDLELDDVRKVIFLFAE